MTALSKALTGFAYDDPDLASAMLRAMTAAFGTQTLQRIATIASSTPAAGLRDAMHGAGLTDVAARVMVALCSGMVATPRGLVVFAYNDALAWRAVPWTKPNAVCGGPTDYWATAPTTLK
jgi:Membrane bound FAD containing D-sorbitol dehydrogenase